MKIKTIIAAIAFMAIPTFAFAQSDKSNEQLSKELGHQIEIISADLKAVKARLKADPANTDFIKDKAEKEAALKEAKEQKKVIDSAIKTAKISKKETEQAEKAQKKFESASKTAERLKNSVGESMQGKSNELISDELKSKIEILNADLKALKARKKADPKNTAVLSEILSKESQLKEAKRQKKVIDEVISAGKSSQKQTNQAEKAQRKKEKAHDNAEEMKGRMQ